MEWPIRLIATTSIAGLLALGACQTGTQPADGLDPPVLTCIDSDGDSYGVRCEAGLDCDDRDPTIWADCEPTDPCTAPRYGCPCDLEGEELECRTSNPVVSPDGSELCYAGVRECIEGIWSRCDSLDSYTPTGSDPGEADGVNREPIVDRTLTCVGSCDAGCQRIHDCPSQTDFIDDGTVYENLRYDLERTFDIPGEESVRSGAATVLVDGAGDGWFIRNIESDCPEDQMIQWWAVAFEEPFFPPPAEGMAVTIEVRAADRVEDFNDGLDWQTLVSCPEVEGADPTCTSPLQPHDRQFIADANLYHLLGWEGSRRGWLQFRIRLTRDVVANPSPRFFSYDIYYFCGEAS
jgi:hypothetical protein